VDVIVVGEKDEHRCACPVRMTSWVYNRTSTDSGAYLGISSLLWLALEIHESSLVRQEFDVETWLVPPLGRSHDLVAEVWDVANHHVNKGVWRIPCRSPPLHLQKKSPSATRT